MNQHLIRRATASDASHIALLLTQLGYPASQDEAAERIAYMATPLNALFVACTAQNDTPLGLVGIHLLPMLHCSALLGKITGLVVDASARGQGVGSALMQAAVDFATEHQAPRIEIISGNHRPEAHAFYRKLGCVATEQTKFNLLTPVHST